MFAIGTPIAKRLYGVADDSRGVREGGHGQSPARGRIFRRMENLQRDHSTDWASRRASACHWSGRLPRRRSGKGPDRDP